MKRFCSVADLRVGMVIRHEGEVVAVCKNPILVTMSFLGSEINLNRDLMQVDTINADIVRQSKYIKVFEFVELLK